MRMFVCLLLTVMLMTLSSCGSKLSEQNVHKVKPGMTQEQVRKILGKPTDTGTAQMSNFNGTVDFYKKEKMEVRIVYMDGKVEMLFLNDTMLEQ